MGNMPFATLKFGEPMKRFKAFLAMLALITLPLTATAADKPANSGNPQVRMTTSMGVVEIELDAKKAPATVKNFLGYVNSGFYNGTIFHRVMPGFMIQGGGMMPGMKEKQTGAKIKNEADNGLKNLTGALAMARTSDPHSASAQFFINTVDNGFLDHRGKDPQGWGYAVFGKVTKGMDVVKKIEAVKTGNAGMHQNVPVKDVVLTKMEVIKADKASAAKK
jgi:cyclophilin family peptidyl-prolyl cis-trans isomerase